MAKPVHAQVKILVKPREEVTAGGIILTHKTRDLSDVQCNFGEVVELGPCAFKGTAENPTDEPLYKVGDIVYFVKHAGYGVKKKDSRNIERLIDWRDVKGIVEDTDDLYS